MRILLVHGLGRTPLSLFGLAATLRRSGHRTQFFAYSAACEPFEHIVNRLVRRLQELSRLPAPLGLIGHSLGGILLRRALAEVPRLPVHHLIMIGSPMQPPRMARLAWRWLLFRLLAGSCGRFLATAESFRELPPLNAPYSLIVGTAGPRGRLSPFGVDENDGLVAVAETRIEGSTAVYDFPVLHTFMMDDRRVRKKILAIIGCRDLITTSEG